MDSCITVTAERVWTDRPQRGATGDPKNPAGGIEHGVPHEQSGTV